MLVISSSASFSVPIQPWTFGKTKEKVIRTLHPSTYLNLCGAKKKKIILPDCAQGLVSYLFFPQDDCLTYPTLIQMSYVEQRHKQLWWFTKRGPLHWGFLGKSITCLGIHWNAGCRTKFPWFMSVGFWGSLELKQAQTGGFIYTEQQ